MTKIRFAIGILTSAVFLYLALRRIDFNTVMASFGNIDYRYLVLSVVCQFSSFFIRAYLWKNILSSEKDVRYRNSFESLMIGYMGNNVLPFRMGEAMRAYAMGEKEKISRTLSFASIILERLLDVFAILIFFLMLLFLVKLERWVILSGIAVFLIFIAAVLILYAVASDFLKVPSTLYRNIVKHFPRRLYETSERISVSFVRGIKLIRNLRHVLWLVFLSLFAWISWTAILYFGLKAFSLELPVTASIFLTVVINIGVMIPSSPGFIGVFQYLCIVALSFFGVPEEFALSFSFFVHIIQYIPTTALGWFYMARMHVGYRMLKKELEKTDVF